MNRSTAFAALAAAVVCSPAFSAVTEITIFRQTDARSRAGTPVIVDAKQGNNAAYGLFLDSQLTSANATSASGPTSAVGNATQDTSVFNSLYFGSVHGNSAATGNNSADTADSFGNSKFQIRFSVDVDTVATFIGTCSASRIAGSAGTGGSALAQVLLLDQTTPANTITISQLSPTSGSPSLTDSFNRTVTLLAGHTYSFQANATSSGNRTFGVGSPTGQADINFWAGVPAPSTSGLILIGGVAVLRRRR